MKINTNNPLLNLITILILLLLSACSEKTEPKTLRVGFNTWPGYEFIYLAKVKGFYKKHGLNVKLVELNALGDVRRAFERGQIDIMASTMVEVLIAAENTNRHLKIIAVVDASNGSDVLLAKKNIKNIKDLKSKKLGMEGATVDVLVAGAALRSVGMSLKDVTIVAKSQDDLVAAFKAGQIDAIQTYPPYSIKLQKTDNVNKIFDTSKIPGEIVDTLSVDSEILISRRQDIRKFLKAYYDAFDYYYNNQDESSVIMGKREGISGNEFKEALAGMLIIGKDKQLPYLKENDLGGKALKSSSDALYESGWLKKPANISQFFDNSIHELMQ